MNSLEPRANASSVEMGEEWSSTGEGKNEDIFWEVLSGETCGETDMEEAATGDETKVVATDKATQKQTAAIAFDAERSQ